MACDYSSDTGDLAFFGSTKMLQVYHEIVQPCTRMLETQLSLPSDIAPMISISIGVYVPLYFIGAVFFALLRFSGSVKCASFSPSCGILAANSVNIQDV